MYELINEIFAQPGAALLLIFNIILLEVLLSVDNAAVLATMVMDLPKEQRSRALKYGIVGAYVFRGLALIFASYVVEVWWLKPIGGLYLMYLTYGYFKGKQTETKEDDIIDKKGNWLYRATVGYFGVFWATVALVELMDMAFSIDNIFAVVAFSDNIILIVFGVFVGILAMRFVAQRFVKLIETYKFLETAAFVVIGVLGIKLFMSLIVHYNKDLTWLEGEYFDMFMSALTILIFAVPLLTSKFFNYPKKNDNVEIETEAVLSEDDNYMRQDR